jgi:hypothetical protein
MYILKAKKKNILSGLFLALQLGVIVRIKEFCCLLPYQDIYS